MAGNIFINYRRGDDPGFTQALFSRLEQAFSAEQLFMDVDNIAPGLDFVQVLNEQVARCDVLIAVIGKNWLAVADDGGRRRLDNPEDFVRIEIESALAQKKRVIPVLVNDAQMPRSTELPESLRPFARCNAVRLTHERVRADMQGLIKALKDLLTEADASRPAGADAAGSEAGAKDEGKAERSRRERRARSGELEVAQPGKWAGLVSWIVDLQSEVAWAIPAALAAVCLLGWVLPGYVFMPPEQGGFGWGLLSLLYGLGGLLALGVLLRVRWQTMGGSELAVYWFALMGFLGLFVFSLVRVIVGPLPSQPIIALLAVGAAVTLIAVRREEIGGLEFAVYWFGLVLLLFWAAVPFLAGSMLGTTLATYFDRNEGYRAAGIVLGAVAILSAVGIMLWRNRRMSGPEAAVYLLGAAYMLYVGARLA
jgi:hypothetical protein